MCTGSLTKPGAGNLILSGSSSYSGATSVAAGRLSVNGILRDTTVTIVPEPGTLVLAAIRAGIAAVAASRHG